MRLSKKTIGASLLAVLVLLGLAFGLGRHFSVAGDEDITSELVGNRLEEAKELTTSKYFYTNTGAYENDREFYGLKLPFTNKKFIVSYDGIIHAGVDLAEADISINGDKIQVKLPKAKILSHEIDSDSVKVFDEEASIFNQVKVEDYSKFSNEQKKTAEKKAVDKGLLEEAEKQAQQAVEDLLNMDPEIHENYQVEVRF
ncbi:DUF4230 domain-containing protein [Aerococcus sanguinicola]|uniref:DUF4230 domain-containing protein n=1 Tax=Aerococcus sanguinicola TaxID=119206 RepID=A0A0X8FAS9_9LACT|nr:MULTISPECIES: DUF4230 domain-containing protein [Aerococcus]AMB93763.1 hypothetical protein AWM72_02850 [Aerococcus sanguinicola]MDK7050386.1 DUF4230 domain-containing protein [Aerococcus sanguinicola]OFT94771.1 hypothetical protein HMPREF3090_05290 [Aerococcus sp. HMSC23C02]PKZ21506.1 DUF4230 domain-containing protein [Aerococcus sanguinicola]